MSAIRKQEESMVKTELELNKNTYLETILNEISTLPESKFNQARIEQISNFIQMTVNGDIPSEIHVMEATLDSKDPGVLIFILTNKRLIKISISEQETSSQSYPFNTFIGINKKLLIDERYEFEISFQNGSIGLRFPQNNNQLATFLQKVETKIESIEMRSSHG